ncbi:hypothetical protein LTR53_012749 [Teratosphaeriaceae sp. CCFEE 6253]|nr:hypothetical protein LTR53_012749 [Teratosphaeriaceae sp. CCFEE 6253]
MPRVRGTAAPSYAESPAKKVQIPLNDDGQEKAARLHSRKLLANKQLDQLKAAASPARKRRSLGGGDNDPATPSQDVDAAFSVTGDAVTPMKRVPLLANFEEWMKMATDNKINAANSWNFALIDYFHDMSLLREGDGVNFQKASCTLDGCVKIYTSRVDSVATETGRLLSGLADGGGKKRKGGDEGEEAGEDEDEEGEEGAKKKTRKKANRSAEATLATSFEQLRVKKMELEFAVDPLFKKAAADFDEGGAKGLLMNHLSIDSTGRIVFDSSDDVAGGASDETRRDSMDPESEPAVKQEDGEEEGAKQKDGPIDLARLAARFFPDLDRLDTQDICPSLKTFELGGGVGATLDLPFLKAPDNWRDEHPEIPDRDDDAPTAAPAFGADDDNDADGGGATFDLPAETGFGEGGEAWARDAALHAQPHLHHLSPADSDADPDAGGEVGTFDTNTAAYGVSLHHHANKDQENILQYFDTALRQNWAGPEHWKIARIKETHKSGVDAAGAKKVRKEKEPFEIDFAAAMTGDLAAMLGGRAQSNAAISLPRAQWRSAGRNLLPDDKHFDSKDLLTLFLKPKARIGARIAPGRRRVAGGEGEDGGEMDDVAYWAAHHNGPSAGGPAAPAPHPMDDDGEMPAARGDYDADFFQDDNPLLHLPPGIDPEADDDAMEFADAAEHLSPAPDDGAAAAGPEGAGIDSVAGATQGGPGMGEGGLAYGVNLVTQSRRLRPEYVQYARVAKKVDVRRLKENMWVGMGFADKPHPPPTPSARVPAPLQGDAEGALRFTEIMNNLQTVYARPAMADISTSYGFICLLHLANEKGLKVENVEGWGDLVVRRDVGVGGDGTGEE